MAPSKRGLTAEKIRKLSKELSDQSEEENEIDSDETDDSDNLSNEEDNEKTDIFTTEEETNQTTSSFIRCNNTEGCTLPPPTTKDRARDIMNVVLDPTPSPNFFKFEIQPFSEQSVLKSENEPVTDNSVPILNYLFSNGMVQKFFEGIDLLSGR
ncbi:hypothetical protein TNCV_192571 [Trichonephila clavipes]|nr:hypothetical protein TNCV_192571 [Trichonephila clavipes]